MAFQVSPGVTVKEIDLTTIVPAVTTSEAGIVGQFKWGPLNERVLVTNEDDMVRVFNKPFTNTVSDAFFTAASFLSYSNQLYVVRVADETSGAKNATVANSSGTLVKNDDDYDENFSTGVSNAGNWIAKYPGALGNSLKVSICPSGNAFETTLSGTLTANKGLMTVDGEGGADFTNEVVVGDILTLGSGVNRQEIKVSAITDANTLVLETAYTGETVDDQASTTKRWEYFNFVDVAPGTSQYANTLGGSGDEIHIAVIDEDGEWTGTKDTVLEVFPAVSLAGDAKNEDGSTNFYKNVVNQRSKFIRFANHSATLTNAGNDAKNQAYGTSDSAITNSMVGGNNGISTSSTDFIRGYNKFKDGNDVDVSIIIGADLGGDTNAETVGDHIVDNIVGNRKDCVATFSPKRANVVNNEDSEATDIITFRNTFNSSTYTIMDSGWKKMYDKYNDIDRYVPLNGDTAGTMVNTDLVADPWFSPGGYNRGQIKNVKRLAWNPRKADLDLLYKNAINPIITKPGQGTVLFGDKTMTSKPSAFDRINVRRLFIVLEKAIARAADFSLFEFNDEFTRSRFVSLVEPFLRDVQGRRGIQNFRVVCDETNNTPEVIDRNEFVGDIYIKPARSINFITLNFVAVRSGVEFNEIVGQF